MSIKYILVFRPSIGVSCKQTPPKHYLSLIFEKKLSTANSRLRFTVAYKKSVYYYFPILWISLINFWHGHEKHDVLTLRGGYIIEYQWVPGFYCDSPGGCPAFKKSFMMDQPSRCKNIDLSSKNFVCVSVTFQIQESFEGNVIDLIFIKLDKNILLVDAYACSSQNSKFENFERFMRALKIVKNSIFHKVFLQSLH